MYWGRYPIAFIKTAAFLGSATLVVTANHSYNVQSHLDDQRLAVHLHLLVGHTVFLYGCMQCCILLCLLWLNESYRFLALHDMLISTTSAIAL